MLLTESEIIRQSNINKLFMHGLVCGIHYRFIDKTHFMHNGVFHITNPTQIHDIEELVNKIKESEFLVHIYYDSLIEDSYCIMYIKVTNRSFLENRLYKIYKIKMNIFERKMKPFFEKEYKLLR